MTYRPSVSEPLFSGRWWKVRDKGFLIHLSITNIWSAGGPWLAGHSPFGLVSAGEKGTGYCFPRFGHFLGQCCILNNYTCMYENHSHLFSCTFRFYRLIRRKHWFPSGKTSPLVRWEGEGMGKGESCRMGGGARDDVGGLGGGGTREGGGSAIKCCMKSQTKC
jgi:hypothetical protein